MIKLAKGERAFLIYDVVIVGAGPAGIFAALELLDLDVGKILILEKGSPLEDRLCPLKETRACGHCVPCRILSGWGGAGAFSDGKLTLSPHVGGFLGDIVGEKELEVLIQEVDGKFLAFGAPEQLYGAPCEALDELANRCTRAGLMLVPVTIRPMGTDCCVHVLKNLYRHLESRIEILFNRKVVGLRFSRGMKELVVEGGKTYKAQNVILAPGREANLWLKEQLSPLGVAFTTNPVDVGVRVEVPTEIMEEVTSLVYELKLLYNTAVFDDEVRTFCMCPHGEVLMENWGGLFTVNGHSYRDSLSLNTNFALLVRTFFTEPFDSPIDYGAYLARLANLLVGTVIVQRLGDLKLGRRSTQERIRRGLVKPSLSQAVPGDLSYALPYRYLVDVMEMLEAMDRVIPGINSRHTLLYGVEVKFYSLRPVVNSGMETPVSGLFVAGDGAGVSRGLVQAAASGMIAARTIAGGRA